MERKTVLLCRCATHNCLDKAEVCRLNASLEQAPDIDLKVVDDLCGLMAEAGEDAGPVRDMDHVVACFPRAVRGLLNRTGRQQAFPGLHNLHDRSAKEILLSLNASRTADGGDDSASASDGVNDTGWRPWFPVIDYDRCTDCGQCISFCLFDVFEKEEKGTVIVAAPQNCKDNCPACARICPEVAIMFPKAGEAPINGDDVQDELLEREKARIAMEQSGGANLHGFLSARNRAAGKQLLKPEARRKITGGNGDGNEPEPGAGRP